MQGTELLLIFCHLPTCPPHFSTHPVHSVLKGHLWSVPLRQSSQRARGVQVHAGSRLRTQGIELLLKFRHLPTCPPPFATHPVHSVLKGHLWSLPLRQSSQHERGVQVHAGSRLHTQGTELLLKFCHLPTCPPFLHSCCALCIKRASVERATPPVKSPCTRGASPRGSRSHTQGTELLLKFCHLPTCPPLFTLMLCTLY